MIKQYISKILALSIFLLVFITPPPANAQENLIFGQQHSYSVFLKSNQESFVFARMVLTNPNDSKLSDSSFTLNNATAYEMSMYQVVLPQECAQYDYSSDGRECVRYEEPSYTQGYSYAGSQYGQTEEIEYYNIDYTESDGKYSYELAKPVEPFKSTAVIAIYATKDYVDGSLGRYKFDFKTLVVDQRVTESNVAVTVETDYTLKNPDKVKSYDYPYYGIQEGINSATVDSSFTNPDIDSLVYSIGGRGELNKSFSNVTPGESSVVSGMFASSWFMLHLFELIFTVLGIAAVFYLLFKLSKKYNTKTPLASSNNESSNSDHTNARYTFLVPVYWIASFVSAALVAGLTYLGTNGFAGEFFGYIGDGGPVAAVFGSLAVGFLYLFIIFGPAVYIGAKRNWKSGVTVIVLQFVWYIFGALLLSAFLN